MPAPGDNHTVRAIKTKPPIINNIPRTGASDDKSPINPPIIPAARPNPTPNIPAKTPNSPPSNPKIRPNPPAKRIIASKNNGNKIINFSIRLLSHVYIYKIYPFLIFIYDIIGPNVSKSRLKINPPRFTRLGTPTCYLLCISIVNNCIAGGILRQASPTSAYSTTLQKYVFTKSDSTCFDQVEKPLSSALSINGAGSNGVINSSK